MKTLEETLYNPIFSHIYIEQEAYQYPLTGEILKRFIHAKYIMINHYKDVFCRGHQDYVFQKQSPKLILAVKKAPYIYEGAKVCDSFGNQHFYYTSTMMNCLYECEYCYLQGMYTSANIVIFVNIEDVFDEVKGLLKQYPIYVCISYDTDLLALEKIAGHVHRWCELASSQQNLTLELRTKSANYKVMKDIPKVENMILAWTLSPQPIIEKYELKTPSLKARLASAKEAIADGYKVRVCFDPLLYEPDWQKIYEECVDETFSSLQGSEVFEVSIGTFRVSKDYLKLMRKSRPTSALLQYPFETAGGVCSYSEGLNKQMKGFVHKRVAKYIEEARIYD